MSQAHQADWVRLNTLYEHGGVWLDATCICFESVETWVDLTSASVQGFSAPWCNKCLENWAFVAPKRHPLIGAWLHEFALAVRIGFDEYKHRFPLKTHPVHDWLTYLTQHACYIKVTHNGMEPADMRPACGGPMR